MSDLLTVPRRWFEKNNRAWIYLLVIAGTLLLSFALPFYVSVDQLTLPILTLVGLGFVLILLRNPPLGLVLLIVVAIVVPSPRLPGGLNIAVLFLALLIALWLLRMIAGQRQVLLVASRPVKPLLLFVGAAILAFAVGQLPWFAVTQPAPMDAQLGGLAIFVLAAGGFLLVAHQIRDLRWLQLMVWLYIAIGSVHLLGWIVPGMGRMTSRLFQYGTTSNSMFWVWLISLAFSQALLNNRLSLRWRGVLIGVVIAAVYVALVRNFDWKSGWIPSLVSMAAIVGFRNKRIGVLVILIGIGPALVLGSQAIASDQYSYSTRLDAWLIGLEIIKINPIFGLGPANYYWYTPFFSIRGYFIQFNSHSQYVDIVAQTGVLGLVLFFWFALEAGWLGWRIRERLPDGFARAYVYGALGGLVGMLAAAVLVDWILPFVYNIGLEGFRLSMLAWVFLGGIVAIEQIYRHQV